MKSNVCEIFNRETWYLPIVPLRYAGALFGVNMAYCQYATASVIKQT